MRSVLASTSIFMAGSFLLGNAQAQTTILSRGFSGDASNGGSIYPEISPDGRFIVFQSSASNLVSGDDNGVVDVFWLDRWSGTTLRVSETNAGEDADKGGLEPALSDDGRYVTFFSYATDLVPNDMNGKSDIFVHDTLLRTTTRVSASSAGLEANGGSRYAVISGDGRYIAFESFADNLVAGDLNGVRDIFVHDRTTGSTQRASVDALGQEANGESLDSSISADGRYLAFESKATNLVAGDANGVQDIFVKDLQTGSVTRVSVSSAGVEGDLDSEDPSLSASGRYVVFGGEATNLVSGDTNGVDDIFLHDMLTGNTSMVSRGAAGQLSDGDSYDAVVTPDGRTIVFYSAGTNLVAGDGNGVEDIFLHDTLLGTTERVSIGSAGQEGDQPCFYAATSADGRLVAYDSESTTFVLADANAARDIFLFDRQSAFSLYCPGDGTQSTPCPCGNNGLPHRGCDNSAASGGATLEARGLTNPDTVQLFGVGFLPSTIAILIQGDGNLSQSLPFGDGVRCVGGALKRMYLKAVSGGVLSVPDAGDPSLTSRSAALGDPILPGSSRYYQIYYRDPTPSYCNPGTFNLTNAVRIEW